MSGADKSVEIGIVGMGRIGRVHLGNIAARLPHVHVRYVCDLLIEEDAEMRAFVEARVPASCRLVTDYREVMADGAVQAVLCLASTNNHVAICQAAIAAGKHVFCEKPVAMEVAETVAIMEAAAARGVLFQVGFNRRFDHNFKHIRDTVASGRLGRPTVVHVISRDPTYDLGYIRRSIEEGGMFVDMTIHDFDMVQYMLGDDDPIVEVTAYGAVLCAPEIGALGDVDTAHPAQQERRARHDRQHAQGRLRLRPARRGPLHQRLHPVRQRPAHHLPHHARRRHDRAGPHPLVVPRALPGGLHHRAPRVLRPRRRRRRRHPARRLPRHAPRHERRLCRQREPQDRSPC